MNKLKGMVISAIRPINKAVLLFVVVCVTFLLIWFFISDSKKSRKSFAEEMKRVKGMVMRVIRSIKKDVLLFGSFLGVLFLFFWFINHASPGTSQCVKVPMRQLRINGNTDITVGYRTQPKLYCPSPFYPPIGDKTCHPTLVQMPEENLSNHLDASWPSIVNSPSVGFNEGSNYTEMKFLGSGRITEKPPSDTVLALSTPSRDTIEKSPSTETISVQFVSLSSTEIKIAYRRRSVNHPLPNDTYNDEESRNFTSIPLPHEHLPPVLDPSSPILVNSSEEL